jgi:hypothetical protein
MRRDLWITGLAAAASAALYLSLTLGVLGAPFFAYFVQLPLLFIGLSLGLASAGARRAGLARHRHPLRRQRRGPGLPRRADRPSLLDHSPCAAQSPSGGWQHRMVPAGADPRPPRALCGRGHGAGLAWVRFATGSIETPSRPPSAQVIDQLGGAGGQISGDRPADCRLRGDRARNRRRFLGPDDRGQRRHRPVPGAARRPGQATRRLRSPSSGCRLVRAGAGSGDLAALLARRRSRLLRPGSGRALRRALSDAGPRRRAQRGRAAAGTRLALTGFYLVLLLFSWPLVVGVVLLGLLEDWAHFRRRLA